MRVKGGARRSYLIFEANKAASVPRWHPETALSNNPLPKAGTARAGVFFAPFRTRATHIIRLGAIALLFLDRGPRSAHKSFPYPYSPGSQNGTYALPSIVHQKISFDRKLTVRA